MHWHIKEATRVVTSTAQKIASFPLDICFLFEDFSPSQSLPLQVFHYQQNATFSPISQPFLLSF